MKPPFRTQQKWHIDSTPQIQQQHCYMYIVHLSVSASLNSNTHLCRRDTLQRRCGTSPSWPSPRWKRLPLRLPQACLSADWTTSVGLRSTRRSDAEGCHVRFWLFRCRTHSWNPDWHRVMSIESMTTKTTNNVDGRESRTESTSIMYEFYCHGLANFSAPQANLWAIGVAVDVREWPNEKTPLYSSSKIGGGNSKTNWIN